MLLTFISFLVSSSLAGTHVPAHYKEDGSYVREHTLPDSFSKYPKSCFTPVYTIERPLEGDYNTCALDVIQFRPTYSVLQSAKNYKTIDWNAEQVEIYDRGVPPKECNGYNFIVALDYRVEFQNASYRRIDKAIYDEYRWQRFDKFCQKVDISNPPNNATHVCEFPIRELARYADDPRYRQKTGGTLFVRVEPVANQMPVTICDH